MNLMIGQMSASTFLDFFRGGVEGLAVGWLVLDLSPCRPLETGGESIGAFGGF